MPTRKIADLPEPQSEGWSYYPERKGCAHPEYYAPTMAAYPPGIYEHECPACGEKTWFRVEKVTYGNQG